MLAKNLVNHGYSGIFIFVTEQFSKKYKTTPMQYHIVK